MYTSQYSPFHQSSQQHTGKRQTTSYKKYPASKYDDPTDIKHQLFQGKYSSNARQAKDCQPVFFKNLKVNQSLYGGQPDSVIETSRYLANRKNNQVDDYSQLMSHYTKGQNPPKCKQKKSTNKSKKLRSKSCQLALKQAKKTIVNKQEHQELEMYKKLCVTLRKQNQDLETKISKQQKQQSKFSSQVQQLKQKIKKMYDHCIEKNKSSKNVDLDLKHLINKHTGKENNLSRINKGKENSFIEAKKIRKSYQVKEEKSRYNSRATIGDKKVNKRTIDTARTSKRDLNTQSFREDNNYKKKERSIKFVESQLQQSITTHQKAPLTQPLKHLSKFPQYDQQNSDSQLPPNNTTSITSLDPYKQFFQTFTKSLQIFQTNTSPSHKLKAKHLKQAGYEIQWAKQQWLEIVEYLIQKGYVSGSLSNKRTKRAETSIVRTVR